MRIIREAGLDNASAIFEFDEADVNALRSHLHEANIDLILFGETTFPKRLSLSAGVEDDRNIRTMITDAARRANLQIETV